MSQRVAEAYSRLAWVRSLVFSSSGISRFCLRGDFSSALLGSIYCLRSSPLFLRRICIEFGFTAFFLCRG